MPETDEELMPRLRRPSWKDPRLLLGVVILLVSVAGVVTLVSSQDRTVPVYAAARSLGAGEELTTDDLRIVNVRIDEVSDHYLPATEEITGSIQTGSMQFVTAVQEGELVPARAVAEADPFDRRPVALEVPHSLPRAVQPGRLVDIWLVPPAVATAEGVPETEAASRIVEAAEVAAVVEDSSAFGTQSIVTVELLVNPEFLPEAIGAQTAPGEISLVPAGSGAEGVPEQEG